MFTEALFLISKTWNQSRYPTRRIWISKGGVSGKESACNAGDEMQETWVQSLGLEDSLEEATCSIILTWKIPWIEEPDRLQSIVLQRVGHDWVHTHTYTYMNMMHPCNWILFRNFKNNEQKKSNELSNRKRNVEELHMCIAKWKKAIWKGFMILTIKHYAEGKIMETLKRWVIARVSPGVWDNE